MSRTEEAVSNFLDDGEVMFSHRDDCLSESGTRPSFVLLAILCCVCVVFCLCLRVNIFGTRLAHNFLLYNQPFWYGFTQKTLRDVEKKFVGVDRPGRFLRFSSQFRQTLMEDDRPLLSLSRVSILPSLNDQKWHAQNSSSLRFRTLPQVPDECTQHLFTLRKVKIQRRSATTRYKTML